MTSPTSPARRAARRRAADSGGLDRRAGSGESLPATGDFTRALRSCEHDHQRDPLYARRRPGLDRTEREADIAAITSPIRARASPRLTRSGSSASSSASIPPSRRHRPRLYIARRLARAMQGELDVDSAPGQGRRFTFTLPCARGLGPRRRQAPSPRPSPGGPGGSRMIEYTPSFQRPLPRTAGSLWKSRRPRTSAARPSGISALLIGGILLTVAIGAC